MTRVISIESSPVAARPAPSRWADRTFFGLTFAAAVSIGILVALVGWQLYAGARLSLHHFGWSFLGGSTWDPVNDEYGAWPFIFGTFVSSLIALLIAVP